MNALADPVRVAHWTRGSGPPVLLVAGTGYPGATWPAALLERLAQRFTVIAFDHRGTGRTPGTPEPYSTRLFARDSLDLLDRLGLGPAHVIGHSMGGRVAQWMALDAPDRIRTLVLAASGPGQFRPDQRVTRGIPIAAAVRMIEQGYEGYIDGQIRSTFFTPEFAAAHPLVVGDLVRAFWTNRPSLEDYLKHVVARQEHQTAELLDRISHPTLCLVGDRDIHAGGTGSHVDQSAFLAAALPDAELAIVDGAAHGYFWSHTERTAEIVREFFDRRG
jgi:pimeloyl-ACP methyl ester carboxylesterase